MPDDTRSRSARHSDADRLVRRMQAHEATIFGEMSALAARLGAVNLGQGFPDTDGPAVIAEAAIAAIREGRGNQYPPAHGLPELRQHIARHQQRFYDLTPDWRTEVCVATGASEAIVATVLALVESGQEVVMFDPYFDLYPAAVSLAGARRRCVPLTGPDLRPDLDTLARTVTDKTAMIIVNSPHNPSGVVFTEAELLRIAEIATAHDVIVLADEAYEHLWFDGHPHVPIATLPGMWERTVTIGSAGKSFSFTGWKVGWATGPADLIAAVRVVRQHLSYVSSGPFQWAIAEALQLADAYFAEFRHALAMQRDHLADALGGLGFRVIPTQGTYFTTTDVTAVGFADGQQFCDWAPLHAGVVAIPHTALSDHPDHAGPYVRWAFCKDPATIDTAVQRLSRGLADR